MKKTIPQPFSVFPLWKYVKMQVEDIEISYPNGNMETVSTAQEIQRFAFFAHVHKDASV